MFGYTLWWKKIIKKSINNKGKYYNNQPKHYLTEEERAEAYKNVLMSYIP